MKKIAQKHSLLLLHVPFSLEKCWSKSKKRGKTWFLRLCSLHFLFLRQGRFHGEIKALDLAFAGFCARSCVASEKQALGATDCQFVRWKGNMTAARSGPHWSIRLTTSNISKRKQKSSAEMTHTKVANHCRCWLSVVCSGKTRKFPNTREVPSKWPPNYIP